MPCPPVTRLESDRLVIRPVVADDLDDLFEVNGDPGVTAYLPYPTWLAPADGAAWLARMQALAATGAGQQLVAARKSDAKVIGTLLLFKYEETSRRVELGYVLGRAHWRQGYMREAVAALCGLAFGALDIRRIEAEVNPANLASCRLLERLGFVHEGRLRQRWTAKGVTYDTDVYGCLADEWAAPHR
jgi:ribosomal-protein-alanine N-acetyltransferase